MPTARCFLHECRFAADLIIVSATDPIIEGTTAQVTVFTWTSPMGLEVASKSMTLALSKVGRR